MSKPNDYYLNLVTSEHRDKQKFILWLTTAISLLQDASTTIDDLLYFFDIDSASGVQLDTVGKIVGQSREVNFQPSDGTSPILSDYDYRTLLKAKIVKNQWKGQIAALMDAWANLFPDSNILIYDNQDMTMTVTMSGNLALIEKDLIEHGYIVPKPQTVRLRDVLYIAELPAFGFGVDNEYVSGYGKGIWVFPKQTAPYFGWGFDNGSISGFGTGKWKY